MHFLKGCRSNQIDINFCLLILKFKKDKREEFQIVQFFLSMERDPFFFITWISSLCIDSCLKIMWWKSWSLKVISVYFDFLTFLFVGNMHDMYSYSCSRPFGFWTTRYLRIFRGTNYHSCSCHIVLSCFDFSF